MEKQQNVVKQVVMKQCQTANYSYWDAEEGLDPSFLVLWGGTFIDTFEADVLDDIIAFFEADPDPESFDEAEPGGGGFKELLPGDLSLEEVDLLDTCFFDNFIVKDED